MRDLKEDGLDIGVLLGDKVETYKEGRVCKNCSTILSIYNFYNYCNVCRRKLSLTDEVFFSVRKRDNPNGRKTKKTRHSFNGDTTIKEE